MRYTISFDLRLGNDYSVSYQDAPAVRCVVHHHHYTRLLAVHHAERAGGRREQDFTASSGELANTEGSSEWTHEILCCTHKAMRPSDARLNTTFPRAATPAL